MNKIAWKRLILCLAIPLAVGAAAGLLIMQDVNDYAQYAQKPPLSPPEWVFPAVWGLLYVLMGISLYIVTGAPAYSKRRKRAVTAFTVQLALNFVWPLVFFSLSAYAAAFAILLALTAAVVYMIIAFKKVEPKAAWLQLPYLVWLLFALYLNLGVMLLNR